jgi:hypothetical protein
MTDAAQAFRDIMANWRDYNRRADSRLGYPPKSLMLTGDGVVSGDSYSDVPQSEAYAEVDINEAERVQACIDDLPGQEMSSVYNVWMGTRRPMGCSQDLAYASAVTMLRMAFHRRGILST